MTFKSSFGQRMSVSGHAGETLSAYQGLDMNGAGVIAARLTIKGADARTRSYLGRLTPVTPLTDPLIQYTYESVPIQDDVDFSSIERVQITEDGTIFANFGLRESVGSTRHSVGLVIPAGGMNRTTLFDVPEYYPPNWIFATIGGASEGGDVVASDGVDALRWLRQSDGTYVRQTIAAGNAGTSLSQYAADINERGAIIGGAYSTSESYGWIRDPDGTITRLDGLLDPLTGANARVISTQLINDAGQILVTLWRKDASLPAPPTYALLTPTIDGDADFDFAVDFDDLLVLAKHFNAPTNQTWRDGDFTGEGAVDFDDLLVLAKHFNSGATSDATGVDDAFLAQFALAQSLVPEPTTLGVLAFSVLGLSRRRTF